MIEDGKQVSLEYTLALNDGQTVDTNVGEAPLVYEHGRGQILPALEQALAGLAVNDRKKVSLTPEEGYGPLDPSAYQDVPPESIPEDAREPGTRLIAKDDDGRQFPVKVHECHPDRIVLDFNHPLAGETLHFDVKVLAVS